MKLLVEDPVTAALQFGGATWEPAVGWWSQAGSSATRGTQPFDRRNAVYVPTQDRFGRALSQKKISSLF